MYKYINLPHILHVIYLMFYNITCIRMSQIQPILCFKIVLKELSDSDIFAQRGRLFHSEAFIHINHLLPKSLFGRGSAKSVWGL